MMSSDPSNEGAADFTGHHAKYGDPALSWAYQDRLGDLQFYVAMYDTGTSYVFLPWRLVGDKWLQRAGDAPRPLWGLDLLDAMPSASILLVSDERIAAACRRILKPSINYAMTWPGGPKAINDVDWEPLAKRKVNIFPTANEDNWRAATKIAAQLFQIGCTVSVIDTHGQERDWSLADAIQAGWKSEDIIKFAGKHKKPILLPEQAPRVKMPVSAPESSAPAAVLSADPESDVPSFGSYSELWAYYGLELAGNRGVPWPNLDNVLRVLNQHPRFKEQIWWDDFRHEIRFADGMGDRPVSDPADYLNVCLWFQRAIHLPRISQYVVKDAIELFAKRHVRHPLKEELESYHWDGAPRLDETLHKTLGCDDTVFTRTVSRKFLISLIARVYKPGEKVDNMLVLEGSQGRGKTTVVEVLGGPHYAEITEKMGSKDFNQALRGKWIIEVSEMVSLMRVDPTAFNSAISRKIDYYRPSYGKKEIEYPRQCVLVGTTNHHDWLTDETGGRRFWPIDCKSIDVGWLREHRELILAEALHCYRAGEDWWKIPILEAVREQALRYFVDPWQEPIEAFLLGRTEVTIGQILDALGVDMVKRTSSESRRVGKVLRFKNWMPAVRRVGGYPVKVFVPTSEAPALEADEFSDRPP
jgi:putative DNA primase/helicase